MSDIDRFTLPARADAVVELWRTKMAEGVLSYAHFQDHWRVIVPRIYSPQPNRTCLGMFEFSIDWLNFYFHTMLINSNHCVVNMTTVRQCFQYTILRIRYDWLSKIQLNFDLILIIVVLQVYFCIKIYFFIHDFMSITVFRKKAQVVLYDSLEHYI